MAFQEEDKGQISSPALLFYGLYCEEEGIGEEDHACADNNCCENFARKELSLPYFLVEEDLFWTDDELSNLISKEEETQFCFDDFSSFESLLLVARKEAVHWILRVNGFCGFNALSCVLAVNYFDRFISSFKFTSDKPWMGQLAAVACLSLAAKVEETQVPLLLDLQVEESKYVFEAKTIKRMELLVSSILQWRMNPVTPISFFHHVIRRLGLKNHLHWDFLRRCERLLLSVISDSRSMNYAPSILATAIMLHVIKMVEPISQKEYQNQLLIVMKISEEKVNQCYKFILELSGKQDRGGKRKHPSTPRTPNGVIDAYFSSESSNDSWGVSSTVPLSSTPRFKRIRSQDQQMRLHSLNRMFVDVLSSPH